MEKMIDVFGKKYSLSTLKAHTDRYGYNGIIETGTEKVLELNMPKIRFEGHKRNLFSSKVTIDFVRESYDEDYTVSFKEFIGYLRRIIKIYDQKDELYKTVVKNDFNKHRHKRNR